MNQEIDLNSIITVYCADLSLQYNDDNLYKLIISRRYENFFYNICN